MEQRQPFFKPLDSQSSIQTEARGTSFFAPLHQHTRGKETFTSEQTQQEEQNKEKLTSLHAKLYQEADKIRKWKTQTDIEIRQKDKRIKEGNNTIENLRKSVLEVQLQNESLSMKFQQEVEHREEICQKINATRDMCNLLKSYSSKVETRLEECEGDRTQLQNLEKDQVKQFEELSKKFQTLEVTAAEKQKNLLNKVLNEQHEKTDIKGKYEKLINDTEKEVKELSRQCCAKEECINSITADTKLTEEKLGILRVEHAFLQEQYENLDLQNADLNGKLGTTTEELDNSKEMILGLDQVVDERSAELLDMRTCKENLEQHCVEVETVYMDKLTNLNAEYDTLKEQAATDSQRLTEVESALRKSDQILEETKCTKDMLLLERTEMQTRLSQCEESEVKLTKTMNEKESRLSDVSTEVAEKVAQIEHMLVLEAEMEKETERLKTDLHEALQNEKLAYEMVDELKLNLENKCEEGHSTSEKLTEALSEKKILLKKSNTLEKEMKTLKSTFEKSKVKEAELDDTLRAKELSLESVREELKVIEEERKLTNMKLENEVSKANDLKNDLEKSTKEVETLNEKNKTMKAEIAVKIKQNKELEKETRSLRGKFTAKERDDVKIGEVHDQMQTKLFKAQEHVENLETRLNEQLEKNAQFERDLQSLQLEVKKAYEEKKARRKEFEASKNLHDSEMAKMVSLLEEYKLMNQRIVEEKQKEIEAILKNTKEQENKQNDHMENLKVELVKIKDVEKVLAAKEAELLRLKEICEEQKNNLKELNGTKKTLKEKEKSLTKHEKELLKSKETCVTQKEHIKELEKTARTLKETKNDLAMNVKELVKFKEMCNKQEEEIVTLKKQLEEIQILKEKETEVEKLRQEIESLKVASAIKPASIPTVTEKKSGKENRPKKERKPAKKDPTPFCLRTPKVSMIPVQSNPRTPVQSSTKTPVQSNIKTPVQSNTRTPVQSNLRTPANISDAGESHFKRRKVMFSDLLFENDKGETSAESDESCASSSSELMEIETSQIKLQARTPAGILRTPVTFRPSPRVKSNSAVPLPKLTQITPVPRGPVVEKKKTVSKDYPNIRKTPAGKRGNRFFQISPGIKKSMSVGRKPMLTKDTAWFDTDATFGFDPED